MKRLSDTTDDRVEACPACDSASIYTGKDGLYRCSMCGNRFEDPNSRERQGSSEPGHKGPAKKLAKAQPEEWP